MGKIDWKGKHPNSYSEEERRSIVLAALHEIVSSKGGHFNEVDFKNTKLNLEFTCEEGHTWQVPPNNVLNGSWWFICCQTYFIFFHSRFWRYAYTLFWHHDLLYYDRHYLD